MEILISVGQLLLSLSFLVAVHELGHLLAAKYFGMRVEQFSIGFPPKLWSFRKGETEYAVSAIPLGGYVKISGMIDESLDTEAMKEPPKPWEFRSKPAWQRLIVMLGGITVNVLVGIVIFIGLTYFMGDRILSKDEINRAGKLKFGALAKEIGFQEGDKIVKINGKDFSDYLDVLRPANLIASNASFTVDRGGQLVEIPLPQNFIEKLKDDEEFIDFVLPAEVGTVAPGSIAEKVGLQYGDKIIEVQGKKIEYWDDITRAIKESQGNKVTFAVMRGNEVLRFEEEFGEHRIIGFTPKAHVTVEYSLLQSISVGTREAFTTLYTQVMAFGKIIRRELSFRKNISGPIGMAQFFGPSWDWARFWTITGLLSLVLAFMNLLPIPALDGGHVMFLTFEMISGRKPSDKFMETAQKVGMVFLLALMVFIFANDIIKIFTDVKN
ncbi:MAG: RIP metalloprotease RseP [Bacteroidota bacterium]|jgi:regulator of sigma E protease|nr:MAG: RIP metalloprotease RseP [Bacteroidota bacterium]